MSYETVRPDIIEAIRNYADNHLPCGHFLTAVLSNDLVEACGRADDHNARTLVEIVSYCYNEIGSDCWGSPAKVKAWLAQRDLNAGAE